MFNWRWTPLWLWVEKIFQRTKISFLERGEEARPDRNDLCHVMDVLLFGSLLLLTHTDSQKNWTIPSGFDTERDLTWLVGVNVWDTEEKEFFPTFHTETTPHVSHSPSVKNVSYLFWFWERVSSEECTWGTVTELKSFELLGGSDGDDITVECQMK